MLPAIRVVGSNGLEVLECAESKADLITRRLVKCDGRVWGDKELKLIRRDIALTTTKHQTFVFPDFFITEASNHAVGVASRR